MDSMERRCVVVCCAPRNLRLDRRRRTMGPEKMMMFVDAFAVLGFHFVELNFLLGR